MPLQPETETAIEDDVSCFFSPSVSVCLGPCLGTAGATASPPPYRYLLPTPKIVLASLPSTPPSTPPLSCSPTPLPNQSLPFSVSLRLALSLPLPLSFFPSIHSRSYCRRPSHHLLSVPFSRLTSPAWLLPLEPDRSPDSSPALRLAAPTSSPSLAGPYGNRNNRRSSRLRMPASPPRLAPPPRSSPSTQVNCLGG